MILYIVRHAWAGDFGDPQYPNDDLRPLTEKGTKRFRRVAKRLVKRGFAPATVATSPLVRCRQTADLLCQRLGADATPVEMEELRPGAQLDLLLLGVRQQPELDVAWVGHAPDVSRLTAQLIGTSGENIDFPKGATAAIEFAETPAPGAGTLLWFATAEVLGA